MALQELGISTILVDSFQTSHMLKVSVKDGVKKGAKGISMAGQWQGLSQWYVCHGRRKRGLHEDIGILYLRREISGHGCWSN